MDAPASLWDNNFRISHTGQRSGGVAIKTGFRSACLFRATLLATTTTESDIEDVEVINMSCISKDGILRIFVEVENTKKSERTLAYRFDWLNEEGLLLGDEEAWKPVYFYSKEIKTIRSTAPNWLATDAKFLIKE